MGEVREFSGGRAFLIDINLEYSVLGGLLNGEGHPLDPRYEILDVFEGTRGNVFTTGLNRVVFDAFLACLTKDVSTTAPGIAAMLRTRGQLTGEVEEHLYLLAGSSGGPVEAVNGARVLRDLHRRRSVSQAMEEGARQIRSGENECDVAIANAFGDVVSAVETGEVTSSRFERARLVDEGFGEILGTRKREMGMRFGFSVLDERTTGMHPGQLTAIGGRSGGGKTVLASLIARHVGLKQGFPAAFFSLEMAPGTLIQRAAAAELSIPFRNIQKNRLTPEDRDRILQFIQREEENKNFRIEYVPGCTAGQLYLLAHKAVRDMGARLIVVDYAQAVQPDKSITDENAKMSETVPRINEIGTRLNVHVLLLSQLKRAQQGRESEAPVMQDLLYGTKIENVASTVFLPHREWVEGKPGNEVTVHTVKNRNGTLGEDELIFDGARMRFLPASARLAAGV